MGKSVLVNADVVQRALGLVRAILEERGTEQRRRVFVQGLAELFDARIVLFVCGRNVGPDHPGELTVLACGGALDAATRRACEELCADLGREGDPAWQAIMALTQGPVCRTRRQLISARQARKSAALREWQRRLDVDDFILAAAPLSARGCVAGIGLHRAAGARRFSEAERRVVEALNAELGWFYRQTAQIAETVRAVPRRLQAVMRSAAIGASAKQIARETGLSIHTVRDYLKDLYRCFGVSGRAELVARLMGGTLRFSPTAVGKT